MKAILTLAVLWPWLTYGQGPITKLEGTWMVKSACVRGEDLPSERAETLKFVFRGNTLKIGSSREWIEALEGTLELDSRKTPGTVDLVLNDKPALGIFNLKVNELVLCVGGDAKARPAKFKAEKTSSNSLYIMRRP